MHLIIKYDNSETDLKTNCGAKKVNLKFLKISKMFFFVGFNKLLRINYL